MQSPYSFYQQNISFYSDLLANTKKKIYLVGTFRLVVVLSGIFFVWLSWDFSLFFISAIIVLHIAVFLIFLKLSQKYNSRREYAENNLQINKEEAEGLNHNFSGFDGYSERINPNHDFSYDLDVFGEHSLFQSINRTKTISGKVRLAEWMENPLTEKKQILKRRYSIQELSENPGLYLHFRATAMGIEEENDSIGKILDFIEQPTVLKKSKWWEISLILLPALWIVIFILLGLGILDFPVFTLFFFISLFFSYSQTKKINLLNKKTEKKGKALSIYTALFRIVEGEKFSSTFLQEEQSKLFKDKKKASEAIHILYKYIHSLELGKTFPAGFIFNILCAWEIRYALKIEKWKNDYKSHVKEWFEVIANFDALGSLSGFAFNHPDYTYPELAENYFMLDGKKLGHPLLKKEQCVTNDAFIPHAPYMIIVTGANMAGKSTYLRTVGINMFLGELGTPVCAEKMIFYPARLMSSLRTTDSLSNNESYFFAEVKRLSGVIANLEKGEKLFIILDEILKGTNSVDKHKGSYSLVKQFLHLQTCGIIATHDIRLGELEKAYPEQVRNICFEAEVKEDDLSFSYELKEGIARNMNACFLMKKMGICIDEEA
ncbi:MAG: DNA mismatch repair protein MutS [Candidatus Azobacteroides sp.]|nr:DNA mismatch repair protein MutS [Candidatus Azobacteroides sp.]